MMEETGEEELEKEGRWRRRKKEEGNEEEESTDLKIERH